MLNIRRNVLLPLSSHLVFFHSCCTSPTDIIAVSDKTEQTFSERDVVTLSVILHTRSLSNNFLSVSYSLGNELPTNGSSNFCYITILGETACSLELEILEASKQKPGHSWRSECVTQNRKNQTVKIRLLPAIHTMPRRRRYPCPTHGRQF